MKWQGRELKAEYERVVQVPRPDGTEWEFRLRPLRLGFQWRLRELGIIPPTRPTRVARDSQGRPQRDAQGLGVLVPAEEDADYQMEVERYQRRVAALIVAEGIAGDPNWELEAQPPRNTTGWSEYADRVWDELEGAGWLPGDVLRLCEEINRLSHLAGEHLEESQANFSETRPAESS